MTLCRECSKCAIYRIGFTYEERWCTEHHRQTEPDNGCSWGEKGDNRYARRDCGATVNEPAVYGRRNW